MTIINLKLPTTETRSRKSKKRQYNSAKNKKSKTTHTDPHNSTHKTEYQTRRIALITSSIFQQSCLNLYIIVVRNHGRNTTYVINNSFFNQPVTLGENIIHLYLTHSQSPMSEGHPFVMHDGSSKQLVLMTNMCRC